MSDHNSTAHNDLIYQLEDRPGVIASSINAIQHVLISLVTIITPTVIIASTLGLDKHLPYLISMALMVSGVATFIQASRPLGIGSGLLTVQGTSFTFLSAILAIGLIAKTKGGTPEDILSLIFMMCFFGAFIEIFLSQIVGRLSRIATPLVTGIIILLIGISLLKIGMTDLAGGYQAKDFGSVQNLILGGSVLLVIVLMNLSNSKWLKASSILVGLVIGYLIALKMGKVDLKQFEALSSATASSISIPVPFKYGFNLSAFEWSTFLPIAFIYMVITLETMGNITATSIMTGASVKGPEYQKRVRSGIIADGINSIIAAVFNAFPNALLSQNNGLIQISGTASRYIAYFIAFFLILLGLFPIVGTLLQAIPKPVIGGATVILFAAMAASGIKILKRVPMNRRNLSIIGISLGLGLGVLLVPEVIAQLPETAKNIFSSPITTGGLVAIILNIITPKYSSDK